MKTAILLSLLVIAFSSFASAAELCGTLGSHEVGPVCVPDRACPRWIRLQYDLTVSGGERIDLETSSRAILEDFGQFRGSQVCVTGARIEDGFEVTSISQN